MNVFKSAVKVVIVKRYHVGYLGGVLAAVLAFQALTSSCMGVRHPGKGTEVVSEYFPSVRNRGTTVYQIVIAFRASVALIFITVCLSWERRLIQVK